MYRLRTFGGLQLDRGESPLDAVESQRKALALLAVLAAHGSVGRERLLALLWPDSAPDRARGSLKQVVHVLRKQLAAPDLIEGTAELRLNPAWIRSDVQAFTDALRDGRPEEAVEQYGGPFLDGVHIEAGVEFERWVDGRRAEFEARYRDALETLAEAAAARGDAGGAVGWWRRLQGADPLNGRVALRLMEALEAAGDRAAAIRHARIHELLLHEELGLPPESEVRELAERLRNEPRRSAPAASPASSASPAPPVSPASPASPTPVVRVRSVPVLLPLLALVAIVAIIGIGSVVRLPLDAVPGRPPASLAVLPFVNLSEGSDDEYLADGITEEILHALSGIPGLEVPARSSSFYFKGKDLPGQEIARQVGVEALLQGTLRRSGNRIRITAQLVDGRQDRLLWSAAFDREADDLFDAPTLIALQVVQALSPQLGSTGRIGQPPLPPSDPQAHDLYLRGLFHWNRRSAPDLDLALRFFDEATRRDPGYARAWAGLALVYAVLPIGFNPVLPAEDARERLEVAAARALALDPGLADVHAARGLALHFAWRWDEAEVAYLSALELNPLHPTAHQWYGEHLAKMGRGAEGVASVRRAIALDPLSLVAHNDLGLALMMSGRLPEALGQLEATVRMDPAFAIPHYLLHRVYLMTGDVEASAAAGRRWAELTGAVGADEIVTLTRAVADAVLRTEALAILDRWAAGPGPRYHDIAFYLLHLGEADAAIGMLEKGVEARQPMMAQMIAAPWIDPLRSDPRVVALIAILDPPGS